MNSHGGNWVMTLLPFVIIAVVLALRLRAMRKERPLNVGRLWIVPLVYLLIVGSMVLALKPTLLGWELLLGGLAAGAALGWHRGKLIRITRNPDSGDLVQQASPLAMVLLAALVALRLGARSIFGDAAAAQPGSHAMLLTDAFLGFALGLLSATRLEIYLRVRHLLASAE